MAVRVTGTQQSFLTGLDAEFGMQSGAARQALYNAPGVAIRLQDSSDRARRRGHCRHCEAQYILGRRHRLPAPDVAARFRVAVYRYRQCATRRRPVTGHFLAGASVLDAVRPVAAAAARRSEFLAESRPLLRCDGGGVLRDDVGSQSSGHTRLRRWPWASCLSTGIRQAWRIRISDG